MDASASALDDSRFPVPATWDPGDVIDAATHACLLGDCESYLNEVQGLLRDDDPSIRSGAATALGVIGDERVLASLRSVSQDSDASVAAAAALARARLGDASAPAEACGHLTRQLRCADPEKRALAARALGALGLREAREPLLGALRDVEPDVRHDAADALRMLLAPAR